MARSQNATFRGAEPEPDGRRIRGASIARILHSNLSARDWSVGEIDDWRDSGFCLPVNRDDQSLQLVLLPFHGDDDRWILQLAPTRLPSMISRLFGAVPSALPDSVHQLATDVHSILTNSGFSDTLWCWDDFADHDNCTPTPAPVSAA
ncbi:hypothetical protein [Rhodopirellula bahusiensis]|uniref:hypothetical protein n=1 Tax=Rhodopirellula bahusiensis TaxID=2014065 RepID=UPI0013046D15|nr:hypothetical protein [Rhodopirellula bahusiensis]